MRFTKIVCTIGPACNTEEKIAALLEAGMNVARLNFSHGTHEDHAANIGRLRRVANRLNRPLALLPDLPGPKIRTGWLEDHKPVELKDGAELVITNQEQLGTVRRVSTTYEGLPGDVKAGDRILLDDGLLELRVERVDETDVHTRIVHGGLLKEHKGINLPGVLVNTPSLTEKDRQDLAFGIQQQVDYVALSFVRRAE
ncbi:MAG: pyruvate kinase, partial [Anaerolineales bacterium]|nr:pyruvate kinase [Anaerolineales bacterium]